MTVKVEWRSISMEHGEQSAMTIGTKKTPKLCVTNSGFQNTTRCHLLTLTSGKDLDPSYFKASCAKVMNRI